MPWKAMPYEDIQRTVVEALSRNHNFDTSPIMGLPGSVLDRTVFEPLPEFEGFPLLATYMANPNHIGCHTTGDSEGSFEGTHALERDLIRLCAEDILHAATGAVDGYVASGGTESNIQAMWAFRNTARSMYGMGPGEIGILCSADTHYSAAKAANMLDLSLWHVPVGASNRKMDPQSIRQTALHARDQGVRFLLVILNMGTTMFGSIDDPDEVLQVLEGLRIPYLAHVDAAFGGFIHPFIADDLKLDFQNRRLTSFTLDAHKMLQAPYGTGIHLIRKGFIEQTCTPDAEYVPGLDVTLVGSRSGTNAVAVWMILQAYGYEGGVAFCRALIERTDRLCEGLDARGVRYYRHPDMNVVAMHADHVPSDLIDKYTLVPNTHTGRASWMKIVVMDHVIDERIEAFLGDLPEVTS